MENRSECQGVPGVVSGAQQVKLVPLFFVEGQ